MALNGLLKNIGSSLADVGAAASKLGRDNAVPTVGQTAGGAVKAIYGLGQKLGRTPQQEPSNFNTAAISGLPMDDPSTPAISESSIDEPATATIPESFNNESSKDQSSLTAAQLARSKLLLTSASVSSSIPAHVTSEILRSGTSLFRFWKEKISPSVQAASQWIHENPKKAALIAASFVVVVYPTLVIAPALLLCGFGGAGPIAGSLAAAIHAMIGNAAANSLFATLQSAAMGGYGAAIVTGSVQVVLLMVIFAALARAFLDAHVSNEKAKKD